MLEIKEIYNLSDPGDIEGAVGILDTDGDVRNVHDFMDADGNLQPVPENEPQSPPPSELDIRIAELEEKELVHEELIDNLADKLGSRHLAEGRLGRFAQQSELDKLRAERDIVPSRAAASGIRQSLRTRELMAALRISDDRDRAAALRALSIKQQAQ